MNLWGSTAFFVRSLTRPTLTEADGNPILQAIEENNAELIRSWFTGREEKVNHFLFKVPGH